MKFVSGSFFNLEPSSSMPFTLREMVPMSLALRNACLGIIELAHPDAKFAVNEDYRQALHLTGIQSRRITDEDDENETRFWAYLFKVLLHSIVYTSFFILRSDFLLEPIKLIRIDEHLLI